ncbi:MAG: glycosyltransferase family 39 protein [Actinomycetota bacterium]
MRALAFVTHIAFIFIGRINGDEGAYLHAARLVARGQVPYRDFAFTQMPFLPYVHALPQTVFGPSLLVGRVTSAAFAIATIALAVAAAKRLAGERGAAIAATLFAAFTLGAYMNVIVKTHAVTSFFVVGALWVLTTSLPDDIKLALSTSLGTLATATRLSSVAFAFVLFWIGVRDPRSRRDTVLLSLAIGTCVLAVTATNPDGAIWGLRDFHVEQWTTTGGGRIKEIVTERLPRIVVILGPFAVLGAAAWRRQPNQRTAALVGVVGIGSGLYAAIHLVTGQWHDEYLVPLVCISIPLVAALATRIDVRWQIAVLVVVAVAVAPHGFRFVDIEDGRLPLDRAADLTDVVATNSDPDDAVFALSAMWAVVEADRDAVPGTELLNAGVTATSPGRAAELGVLTPQDVVRILATANLRVVVITPSDRASLQRRGGDDTLSALDSALAQRYTEEASFEDVGQSDGITKVYVLSP